MKKKITAIALVICLMAVAVIGGSLAYFTDNDEATNTFTVGNVKIDLTEPNWEGTGSNDAPEVYPGEALAKDPTVTNTGANPCFVRISVTGLDCLGDAGDITYRTKYVEGALGEGWVKNGDYFYYTKVLAVDEKTTPLFDQIVIPTGLTNENGEEYSGSYDVDVYAEAVQAQGAKPSFTAVQAMTIDEIVAWFGVCMPASQA